MKRSWIVATLVALFAATPPAQAQSAKDALEKLKKAEKDKKAPEEKARVKEKADKEKADKEKAEKEKADKEKADKEKADKEKADKEKAEKEKADKEKADKEKGKADAGVAAKSDAGKGDKAEDDDEKDAPAELVKLRETRDERRKASIEKLKVRWGDLASNGNGKDELERHARFVANLQRIRALAEAKKKVKLIEKIDTLLTKEELRHSTNMNKLRDTAVPVAGGAK